MLDQLVSLPKNTMKNETTEDNNLKILTEIRKYKLVGLINFFHRSHVVQTCLFIVPLEQMKINKSEMKSARMSSIKKSLARHNFVPSPKLYLKIFNF